MTQVDSILAVFVDEKIAILAGEVVSEFQGMTDSCTGGSELLASPWEEFVVQVRGERWSNFGFYEAELNRIILGRIQDLPPAILAGLWLRTESGRDWLEEVEDGDDQDYPEVPFEEEEIVSLVFSRVWQMACDFSNRGIEEFLSPKRES